jgi:lipoate-protein ligase A
MNAEGERWFLLRSGLGESAWNMALDHALLENATAIGRPVLRLYGWIEPAATFGYFQKYAEVASWTDLRPLIRRPTGGGLVPHDKDWTYSVVFPPGHWWYESRAEESYQRIHAWIAAAFEGVRIKATLAGSRVKEGPGQCFVGAEKFDVLCNGKKIAGAAQRRNQNGLLIQGSVQGKAAQAPGARAEWEESLISEGRRGFSIQWLEFELPAELRARVEQLCNERYSRDEYNQKR